MNSKKQEKHAESAKAVVFADGRFIPVDSALGLVRRLMAAGRMESAISLLDRIMEVVADHPQALHLRGLALYQSGKGPEALADMEKAAELHPGDAELLGNLGQILSTAGRGAEAVSRLDAALAIRPRDPGLHNARGNALRQTGNVEEARRSYEKSTKLDAGHVDAWMNRGMLANECDRPEEAITCFETAARIRGDVAAFAALAATSERAGDLDGAERAARAALSQSPIQPSASLTLARVMRRRGKWAEAKTVFGRILTAEATDRGSQRARGAAAQELALIAEHEENYSDALMLFGKANMLQVQVQPKIGELAERFHGELRALQKLYNDNTAVAKISATVGKSVPPDRPVFMVGFPRSGTTLLVRALACHPGIDVLDEKPTLGAVFDSMTAHGLSYPRDLTRLSSQDLAALRDVYWNAVRTFGGAERVGRLLVDKDPINTVHIGLIQLLFPGSRIVYSIRDPRDACLSCFGNLFRVTPALATFTTLDGAARTFAAVWALWKRYRSTLVFDSHIVRYEELVSDFEGEMRALLAFLDRPWDDAVTRYHETSGGPLVRTPSYDQVTRRPYRDSIGRWHHFKDAFDELGGVLDEAVRELGYE